MITCCELALYNGQLALRIAIGAFILLALLFAMFFGYNLKWRKQQNDLSLELSKRTEQLEKKNGKEQKQIEEVKKQLTQLQKKLNG